MARPKNRRKTRRKKTLKLPKGLVTVAQGAKVLGYTTSGIYAAILRGDIPVKRRSPQIILERKQLHAYRQRIIDYWKERERIKSGNLTEEEFLQALWDSDPD